MRFHNQDATFRIRDVVYILRQFTSAPPARFGCRDSRSFTPPWNDLHLRRAF